jgi:hypothetical protein
MNPREVVVLDTCDCCVLLDGDLSHKSVKWCPLCRKWLCDACRRDWPRRGRAIWMLMLRSAVGVVEPPDDAA